MDNGIFGPEAETLTSTRGMVRHLPMNGQAEPDLCAALLRRLRPTDPDVVGRTTLDPGLLDEVGMLTGPGAAAWAVETGRRLTLDMTGKARAGTNPGVRNNNRFFEVVTLWAVLRLSGAHALPNFLMRELTAVAWDRVSNGASVEVALRLLRYTHAALTQALFEVCTTELPIDEQATLMRAVSIELFDGMETLTEATSYEFIVERERWLAEAAAEQAGFVHSIPSL